jgi:hypothetical protein
MAGLDRPSIFFERLLRRWMDTRAYASPKGLRPRRRVKPAYDAECICALLNFMIYRFKQPHFRVLAAQCVRGLPIPREQREAMERWEAPGHQWAPLRRVVNPPRAARRPRAPKARRSASQRSTGHQARRPFRGAPVRPAFALSAEGSLLESAPSSDRTQSG